MISVEDHDQGKRIIVEGPKGKIVVTVEVDEEGIPVVDLCPEPAHGFHTLTGYIEGMADAMNVLDHRNRQLYVTFSAR